MQAVILAGGLGTRLHPLTQSQPKCMVQVGGFPFLQYQLNLLKARGVRRCVLLTGHLGSLVEGYFRNGAGCGLSLSYSREENGLLGTGGALKKAEPLLEEKFLLVNGDTYLDMDYAGLYAALNSGSRAVIAASRCGTRFDLDIDPSGKVLRYDKSASGLCYVNAGAMALRRDVLSRVLPGKVVSLEADILPPLICRGEVLAFHVTQPFYDIGSFEGLGIFQQTLAEAAP
jgi:NDP-sugar pyrophosphorylase family protein